MLFFVRGTRGLGLAVCCVLLAGCVGDSGLPVVQAPERDGWRRVGVPGDVRSMEAAAWLVVASERGGRPGVFVVKDGHAVPMSMRGGPGNGVRSVATNGETVALAERTDVAAGAPATLWWAIQETYPDVEIDWTRETIADRAGRPAVWLQPLLDGEEDYRAIGAVRTGDGFALHGWMVTDHWVPIDRDDTLRTLDPASLRTGTTETTVVVAGEVSAGRGKGRGVQVWSLPDELAFDPADPGRWVREPMASRPDAVTDIGYWNLGWWVAGYRRLRPVVYDYDVGPGEAPGAELPVPDVSLDPKHPNVIVAGVPVARQLVLATQSAGGIDVWAGAGGGRWNRVAGPRGVLTDAVYVSGDGIYLLVDGDLWYRPLEVPELRR